MAKYLLLKHYRGAPAPANDVPMDQWSPDEVDAHIQFMSDFAARLETTGGRRDQRRADPYRRRLGHVADPERSAHRRRVRITHETVDLPVGEDDGPVRGLHVLHGGEQVHAGSGEMEVVLDPLVFYDDRVLPGIEVRYRSAVCVAKEDREARPDRGAQGLTRLRRRCCSRKDCEYGRDCGDDDSGWPMRQSFCTTNFVPVRI